MHMVKSKELVELSVWEQKVLKFVCENPKPDDRDIIEVVKTTFNNDMHKYLETMARYHRLPVDTN